jgi:hypothetical protein
MMGIFNDLFSRDHAVLIESKDGESTQVQQGKPLLTRREAEDVAGAHNHASERCGRGTKAVVVKVEKQH